MWFDLHMDEVHNKDELHFRSIGLAAALILNKLRLATQLENQERYASNERSSTDSDEAARNDFDRETDKAHEGIGKRGNRTATHGVRLRVD
jgi:hypothetical protein